MRLEYIEVAFLPIGDNFTMGPEDAARAVKLINPKLTIPVHFNTFPPIEQDPQRFKALVTDHEVKIMEAGDSFEV